MIRRPPRSTLFPTRRSSDLTGLSTTNNSAAAVSVSSSAGAITDAGDTTTDITAAGAAAVTTLSAATGIGSANALDTTVTTLVATNSGLSGNIQINESDALVIRRAAQTNAGASAGNIDITAAGALTVEAAGTGGLGVTIDGLAGSCGTITLAATGNGNSLALANVVTSKAGDITLRGGSEERRVGEECRSRWSRYH